MADPVHAKPTLEVEDEPPYEYQDTLGRSTRSALITGAAGALLAAVQNTVARDQTSAFGVFTRFGGTIGLYAAMGGTFSFARTASANLREKNDFVNETIGGALAGSIIGLARRSITVTLSRALGFGAAMGVIAYTGHSAFESATSAPPVDRQAQKEEARARYRRPLNETINELGEGRGIYGPGYDERRRQRIKENYGIDVPAPYYENKSL